ncbi:MAG: AI-2E family transporter [Elusimicrobia bacterium]|nr:AI-2E family transporter [Elusimicrobiota bacterium]
MNQILSGPRKASYALFALALVVVARFGLGPFVLSALVAYMIMDLTERRLRDAGARARVARVSALAVFAIMAAALSWIFISFVRLAVVRLPDLLDTVLPRLTALSVEFGFDLPADNALELRDLLVASAKENFSSISKTSGLLTRGFFQVAAGVFAAAMRFLTPREEDGASNLFEVLRTEFSARVRLFVRSFERVVGAQVTISTVNAILTAIFLHAMGFPFKTFLILTAFVCGMVPIIGNVVSNIAIVTAGLIVSVQLATFGLVYLVVIHKLEYILNSRIVGGSIDTPMWMTLVGIVVGEALMGVPGVLLAPALLHYAREEMRALPAP